MKRTNLYRWHVIALLAGLAAIAFWAARPAGVGLAGAEVGPPTSPETSAPPDPMGQARACQDNLKSIATALEMYASDHSGHYPDSLSLLTSDYLKKPLTCPAAGRDTYSYESGSNSPRNTKNWPDYYYVCCRGGHHAAAAIEGDLPALSCDAGLSPELPFDGKPEDARRACESNLKNLATALEMYAVDNSGHYPTSFKELVPNYLAKVPNCPGSGTDTYTATFRIGPAAPGNTEGRQEFYSFHCAGSHQGGSPGYQSTQGLVTHP